MTGKELFESALDLCGLRQTDGKLPNDVSDLEQRALSLINILLAENSVLDCRIGKKEHEVYSITSLSQAVPLCDIVQNRVLPYGLARLLLLGEDDNLASDMNRLYNESRAEALGFGKPKVEPIAEVYK